jgi:nitrogen regulatory protein PII
VKTKKKRFMKAVMILLDQAHYDQIVEDLGSLNIRGFTSWKEVYGKGNNDGFPHFGSHAWPSVNNAILTVVEDDRVPLLLKYLKDLDNESPNLGLRAFVWNIEEAI